MKFNDYTDIWTTIKRTGMYKSLNITNREQMYSYLTTRMTDQLSRRHFYFDQLWHRQQCPYYDVYPSIIPMLTKIDLDISGDHIIDTYVSERECTDVLFNDVNAQLSRTTGLTNWIDLDARINDHFCQRAYLPHLLVRLPDTDHCLQFDDQTYGHTSVKTIFMSFQPVNMKSVAAFKTDTLIYGVTIGIDVGEKINDGVVDGLIPTYLINCIPLDGRSLKLTMDLLPEHDSAHEGISIPKEIITNCVKLCLTLRLIKDDPDLIEPDVLTKDRNRFETGDPTLRHLLIDKAIRRGKHGFRVGHQLESNNLSPHVRKPHPMLVWTGIGRKIPKVVNRKGCIVHREKINQIPTGFKPIE